MPSSPSTLKCTNAPICPLRDQRERVTVTDPAHPLFGREFTLAATTGSAINGHAHVVYRGDVLLKLPIRATGLSPIWPRLPASKLSAAAIRDLIRLALQGQTSQPAMTDVPATSKSESDAKPAPATSSHAAGRAS
jgi:hypothetical protein